MWGNGESTWKLVRSSCIVLMFIALVDLFIFKDPQSPGNYIDALVQAPQIFFGISTPRNYPGLYLTLIVIVRLVAFGFFMSIIIKRFNRR
jgi:hypothetical protein